MDVNDLEPSQVRLQPFSQGDCPSEEVARRRRYGMHMFGGEAGDMRFPIACVIGQLCSVAAEYLRVDSQLALGGDETRDDSRGTALARSDSLDYVQYSQL